ncbi:PO113 protein, partial [Amazona guildingii]|nr:PO113 protein [Amazona guildingii]
LQWWLGTINWLHPLLAITTEVLSPLCNLLKRDPYLTLTQKLTPQTYTALMKVTSKIITAFAHRIKPALSVRLFLVFNDFQPYGLIGQWDANSSDTKQSL